MSLTGEVVGMKHKMNTEHSDRYEMRLAHLTFSHSPPSDVERVSAGSRHEERERKVCRRGKLLLATRVHRIAITELFEQV